MSRWIPVVALFALSLAAPALAAVPQTMSYQGVLTDNAGTLVPDGTYNFTFRIYDVSVAGAALWTETQNNVPVIRGQFNVILGQVTPLTLAFDVQYWLGVTVNGGAELAPRVQLASSPYGLSLRLPFSGTASSAGPAFTISNPGAGADIRANKQIDVGTPTSNGTIDGYQNGVTNQTIRMSGGAGGFLQAYDNSGNVRMTMRPFFSGHSQVFYGNAAQTQGLEMDGNVDGAGNPRFVMVGPIQAMGVNLALTGDPAVQLPADAISAPEILDEPGIAQGLQNYSVVISTGDMQDLATVDVTIPAAGYIHLRGSGQSGLYGTTNTNYITYQIDETAGGTEDATHSAVSGFDSPPNTGTFYTPVTVTRTYFEAAAGTYSFRFEGAKGGADGTAYIWNPVITAIYLPTSRGAVATAANGPQTAGFRDVRRVAAPATGKQQGGTGAIVDLRELELKVERQRAELERSQRDLAEASLRKLAPPVLPAEPAKK